MKQRWLVLAIPVVSAILLGQLACGDDEPSPDPPQKDAGGLDATLAESGATDSGAPDATAKDATLQDATATDATDATDAAVPPLCTVTPTRFDAGEVFYSLDGNLTAAPGTCPFTPSTQAEPPNVPMVVNFDLGASTYNVALYNPYEIVSIDTVAPATDGGTTSIDGGTFDRFGAVLAPDTTVEIKVRSADPDAGGDGGVLAMRTLKFRMNGNTDGSIDASKWTLTVFSFTQP